MYRDSQYFRPCLLIISLALLIGISIPLFLDTPVAYGQSSSTDELVYKELVAIYETNLIRRQNGLAPLRWNRELSEAAREFAEDTVVIRKQPYCGHTDSQGRAVIDRIEAESYIPIQWAENAACGFLEPDVVVANWFESDSHRGNMLTPELREIGIGYYRDSTTGDGYVVQDFAHDGVVAPVIINNEAPATESTEVSLYIYDNEIRNGFNGIGPAVEMMISNSPHFENAQWEPYVVEKKWFLESGTGWRYVFVKKRDSVGRVTITFDAIYLGAAIPAGELTLEYASTVENTLTYDSIVEQFPQAQNWSSVQMGRYWTIDDNTESFLLFNDSGIQQDDSEALGGTAYRLNLSRYDAFNLGENATFAVVWAGDAPANTPLVAYVRAKVENNRTSDKILKIWAESGNTTFGPLTINADEFLYPEIYQDFAIPVEFVSPNSGDPLSIHIYHYGGNEVSLDTVSFFAADQNFNQLATWSSTEQPLRDRGFVARVTENSGSGAETVYEVGGQIGSSDSENPPEPQATPVPPTPTPTPTPTPASGYLGITLSVQSLEFEAFVGGSAPDLVSIDVECSICGENAWWVYPRDTPWLTAYRFFNDIYVTVDQSNLAPGTYEGYALVGAPPVIGIPIQRLNVQFTVVDPHIGGTSPTATSVPTNVPAAVPTATPTPTTVAPAPIPNREPSPEPTPEDSNAPVTTLKATVTPTQAIAPGNFTSRVLLPVVSR